MTLESAPGKRETQPIEVALLYESVLGKTFFLDDCSPVRPGVNQNQIQATEMILVTFEDFNSRKEGVVLTIFGTMGSGKTTTNCLVAERLSGRDLLVYKHQLDLSRTGERLVNNTSDYAVDAKLYGSVQELEDSEILIVDEFQFNTVDTDEEIRNFLRIRKTKGLTTIIGQLDFNFRREPWRTTQVLLPLSDKIIVLMARCDDCQEPAQFVQRNRPDGTPAQVDDPEIEVGKVGTVYKPKCWQHHQVGGKASSYLYASSQFS